MKNRSHSTGRVRQRWRNLYEQAGADAEERILKYREIKTNFKQKDIVYVVKVETDTLINLVRRAPVFAALSERPMDRRDLQDHLDVSRPTVHRLTRALIDCGLIKRVNGEFMLTAFGEAVAAAVTSFEQSVDTAQEIAPLLRVAKEHDLALEGSAFTDATVTNAESGNPYRPANRFMTLLEDTDQLRGLDPSSINPLHLDQIYTRIVGGMETDVVFPPGVVEELFEANPDRATRALESGNLTVHSHDDLPFGVTICDDRIGIGIYDTETGILRTYIDTDDPSARKWAKRVYSNYRNEATNVTEHAQFSELPPIQSISDSD